MRKKYKINIIYIIACYIYTHTIYTEDNPNDTHKQIYIRDITHSVDKYNTDNAQRIDTQKTSKIA